jgi:hypothetical protein
VVGYTAQIVHEIFFFPFTGMALGTACDHDVLYTKRLCTVFKGESWHE